MSLSMHHVSYRVRQKHILQDIHISIKKQQIMGIVGKNGSGKSTLFSLLAGLNRPTHGDIYLDKHTITTSNLPERVRLGIALLHQKNTLFRTLSVWDNLRMVPGFSSQKAQDYLETFSLADVRTQKAGYLSGGEQRKLEIVRALLLNPTYMIMDEPFAAVDESSIEDILTMLKKIVHDHHISIIMTDHHLKFVKLLCQDCYFLHNKTLHKS